MSAQPGLRRRLVRLARTGSPSTIVRAAKRQVVWTKHEREVLSAIEEGRKLLVGPFLGEVGFELLYWIPVLRRLLEGVDSERVTVLTRGGAGTWYRDFAATSVDALELVPAEGYLEEVVARRKREGNTKQFFPDRLDRQLTRLALERVGDAAVVHPLLMYSRMRFVLEGLQPPAAATAIGEYGRLPVEERELPVPADYVAVKLYFSDSFPDDAASRELAARILGELAERTDVVVLTSGRQLDEHQEWVPAGPRIHDSTPWVTPENNLAVQTQLVAGARELVATYGGFSYLGPMLGVSTRALYTQEAFQRVHLDVLHAAYPDARYGLVTP